MQGKCSRKLSSLILCMALVAAVALSAAGCNGGTGNGDGGNASPAAGSGDSGVRAEPEQLGEGDTVFLFTVVDKDGSETPFEIHTDRETVGEALLELELIAGEEGRYGLFVKTVNGITVDYDRDGTYWAFYVNGEYAASGVDATVITEGDDYSLKVQ